MVLVGRLVRPLSRCQDFNEGHRRSHLPCVQTDEDLRRVTGSGSASRFFQVSDQTWEWGGGVLILDCMESLAAVRLTPLLPVRLTSLISGS